MTSYLRAEGDDVLVRVWVVPGASRTRIVGPYGDRLKVQVAAPPEGGRANRAVAKLLARTCDAAAAELEAGAGSRRKVFRLRGVSLGRARRTLEAGDS